MWFTMNRMWSIVVPEQLGPSFTLLSVKCLGKDTDSEALAVITKAKLSISFNW